jgi:hypothetical protein
MKFKNYEENANISLAILFIILSCFMAASGVLLYFNKYNLSFLFEAAASIILLVWLALRSYFSNKAIHDKINYYLKKDKYTEIFLNKKFCSDHLEEKLNFLLMCKADIKFLAKLEGKVIVIEVQGQEISSIKIKNYRKFLKHFTFETNI